MGKMIENLEKEMTPLESLAITVLAHRMKPLLNDEFINAHLKRFDDINSEDFIMEAFKQRDKGDKGIEYSIVQAITKDSEERLALLCLENPNAFDKERDVAIEKFFKENEKDLRWAYNESREDGFPIDYKYTDNEKNAFKSENLFETVRRTACYVSRECFHRCLYSEYGIDAPFITDDNKSNVKVFGDALKTLQNVVSRYESKRLYQSIQKSIRDKSNGQILDDSTEIRVKNYEKAVESSRKLRNKKETLKRNDENNDLLYKLM